MANVELFPSKIKGEAIIPPSKSQTMRAIIFASLCDGTSQIDNFLTSPDTNKMIMACKRLGAKIKKKDRALYIEGVAGKPKTPSQVINAGNSGLVLRFIAAASALTDGYSVITGDESIRTRRVMAPLLQAINEMNGLAISSQGNGHAPVVIKGKISPSTITVNGKDSQVISALVIAASFLPGKTTIHIEEPGEIPFIEMTLYWLQKENIFYSCSKDYTSITVKGNPIHKPFSYHVPADFSSLAFPMVGALITQSTLKLSSIDFTDPQGDKKLIDLLQKMGANIQKKRDILTIFPSQTLEGGKIDAQQYIDAVPLLALLGCFTKKGIILHNASICREKESDRLYAVTSELKKMRANIKQTEDGIEILPSRLYGATLFSHKDHRIAMTLAIAALTAEGKTTVSSCYCVKKSYPYFFQELQKLGVRLKLV